MRTTSATARRTLPATEIRRRGFSDQFRELDDRYRKSYISQIRRSLKDVKVGRVPCVTAQTLIDELGLNAWTCVLLTTVHFERCVVKFTRAHREVKTPLAKALRNLDADPFLRLWAPGFLSEWPCFFSMGGCGDLAGHRPARAATAKWKK